MLLAGDVGGTKIFLGLFARNGARPKAIEIRSYRTLDFPDLGAVSLHFLRETSTAPHDIEAAGFGVAGPITGARAHLTNVPWIVDLDALRRDAAIPRAYLLNDLEALAWSVPVLTSDEIEVVHEGRPDAGGNVALIAAGTGLGIALLPNVDGRLVPRASEGGHVDFAPRNADEHALADALTREYGRVDIERVVSGPGLANIHRILHPHQCGTLTPMPPLQRSARGDLASGTRGRLPVVHPFARMFRLGVRRIRRKPRADRACHRRCVSRRRDRAAHPACIALAVLHAIVPRQVADGGHHLARPCEGDSESARRPVGGCHLRESIVESLC